MPPCTRASSQKIPGGPASCISAAASDGPIMSPNPPTSTSVALAATICGGVRWSLVWAPHSEYSGMDMPPRRAVETMSSGYEPTPPAPAANEAPVATQATATMTRRRSKRSDSQPIGHWSASPPNRAAAMNRETRSTLSPISVPNTGPMV